jgi:hypothetical protein
MRRIISSGSRVTTTTSPRSSTPLDKRSIRPRRLGTEAKKSLTEKFDTTPTVDDESKTKVADYVKALTDQIAATKSYTATLAQLRALGLDDKTYKKLLDEGLAGKDFAEQLLAGGQLAVTSVNALDKQLLTAAKTLANDMSKELYDAGVNAAQAMVDGLKVKQGLALEKQMAGLAKAMVNAIKRELKIKSTGKRRRYLRLLRQRLKQLAQLAKPGARSISPNTTHRPNPCRKSRFIGRHGTSSHRSGAWWACRSQTNVDPRGGVPGIPAGVDNQL